jgi:hypothetical protein
MSPDQELKELERRAREEIAAAEVEDGRPASRGPAGVLAASRVDLVKLIHDGIPELEYVPGCHPWLLRGKRYLIPAPAGTGKSLLGEVIAVGVVEAGGTVAILDVENGAHEYARRLADVLEARDDQEGMLARACSERLLYHAWPALQVTWRAEEWAAALGGVDLAVFDSSRLTLSAAGLAEDSNDDYATFVNALLIPLARAGVTTVVFDNTGHEERNRARGASTKGDLNEVVYVVEVGEEFDRERRGHLRLVRRRTRFAGLPGELRVQLGGGIYAAPIEYEGGEFRPTALMERISRAIEDSPGTSKSEIRRVQGKNDAKDLALRLLIQEGFVRVELDGQAHRHHSARRYREGDDNGAPE